MRFLTRQTDHHICIADESDRLYFFAQIRCPEDTGMDMLNLMAKTGKIDVDLWEKNRVIVSQDLLNSLKEAYKNRNNPIVEMAKIRVSYQPNPVSYQPNQITSADNPQRKGKERKGNIYPQEFLRFWSAYPNKKDKADALKAWKKRNGTMPDVETLLTAIEAQKEWRARAGPNEFRPEWKHPATWLNKGSWEDEVEIKKPQGSW